MSECTYVLFCSVNYMKYDLCRMCTNNLRELVSSVFLKHIFDTCHLTQSFERGIWFDML